MELAVTKDATKPKGTSRGCSITAKPSSSSSPSSSTSSRGLSRRVGVRLFMHRDLITCRLFQSLPQSWKKRYWCRLRQESNSHPATSSSSPFSRSCPPFSSCSSSASSHFHRSLFSCLSSPALKDRDRERDHLGPASFQALDGHPGFLSTPGMTISPWGPSTQPTSAHTTSSTAAPASSLSYSLRDHNSSGWASLTFFGSLSFFVTCFFLTTTKISSLKFIIL